MNKDWTLEALGDSALLLSFGRHMDAQTNARARAAAARLNTLAGIEAAPAYASVTLRFDVTCWPDATALRQAVIAHIAAPATADSPNADDRLVTLPVCYGGRTGPDLADIAQRAGLAPDAVIQRHCAVEYRVAMLGFAPGFAYLSGLDAALATPRRATPRVRVPAGSIAIGGAQTGIYPCELPGGWALIGRTPRRLFDARRQPSTLLQAGDRVRFTPITPAEFERLAVAAA